MNEPGVVVFTCMRCSAVYVSRNDQTDLTPPCEHGVVAPDGWVHSTEQRTSDGGLFWFCPECYVQILLAQMAKSRTKE